MTSRPPVTRIGIVAKHHLRQAGPHLVEIATWLKNRNLQAIFETATANLCPTSCEGVVREKKTLIAEVDMVLILGGTARCWEWPTVSRKPGCRFRFLA